MKKIMIFIIITILVIIVVAVVIMISTPVQKSSASKRDDLLKLTPVGMSMDEVLVVIEKNGWRVMQIRYDGGYADMSKPPGPERIVGEKCINVYLGKINMIWWEGASWAFDEDGILIDVFVERGLNV